MDSEDRLARLLVEIRDVMRDDLREDLAALSDRLDGVSDKLDAILAQLANPEYPDRGLGATVEMLSETAEEIKDSISATGRY